MKIGPTADLPTAAVGAGQAATDAGKTQRTAAPEPTATPATPDASAKIALSSTAQTLRSGGSTAEFDADKVARMTQAIADGTFKIDAGVIADKLIANAQEVLGKVGR